MNYKELCNDVVALAINTGHYFLSEINKVKNDDIQHKGIHDFVSYVDITAEKRIVKTLQQLFPEAGFITEEGSGAGKAQRFNWIIDPLDGTTNFLHHIPLYSVSIALTDFDKVVLGVVYEPNLNECFYAYADAPAMVNNTEIKVSSIQDMNSALLATGFPYKDYGKLEKYLQLFSHFAHHTSGIRRLGSAAVDLVYTACGRFEGFYEYGLQAWDVAAGTFIVQQAGGKVTDFNGNNNFIFGNELLASNNLLHNDLLNAIKAHFNE